MLCVPLDDFNLFLRIDFFLKALLALLPHLGRLMILEEIQPCFVHALRGKIDGKDQFEMLFAI